jgi:hypothetical protein
MAQYRRGRDSLLAEVATALGQGVLVVEADREPLPLAGRLSPQAPQRRARRAADVGKLGQALRQIYADERGRSTARAHPQGVARTMMEDPVADAIDKLILPSRYGP